MLTLLLACGEAPVSAPIGAIPPSMSKSASPSVTVYLSTGANLTDRFCHSASNTNCDLYAVDLSLTDKKPLRVEKIASAGTLEGEPSGLVEATLSPDERRLVWLERSRRRGRLVGFDLDTKATHVVVPPDVMASEGHGRGRPEWPEFVTDRLLVFDGTTSVDRNLEHKTVYTVDVTNLASPGRAKRQMGALGKDGVTLGSQDPAVWRGPGPAKIVTFGPNPRDGVLELAPRVQTLDADGTPGPETKVFDLGTNKSGKRITDCHHPAWNYAGDAILCQAHLPEEFIEGVMTRMLYTYRADAKGNWANPTRTFEPVRLDKIGTDSAPLFADLTSFERQTYKYAQWCGDDNHVIATVFTSSKSKTNRGEDPFVSRVMLIGTNPVTYTDITSAIEAAEGKKVGDLSSFTATCSRAK